MTASLDETVKIFSAKNVNNQKTFTPNKGPIISMEIATEPK